MYPVAISEYLEHNNLKEIYPDSVMVLNIESGLSAIEAFLKKDDFSNIYTDTVTARNVKQFIRVLDNPANTFFEVVAIHSIQDQTVVFTVNSYLYFEKAHFKQYKGSFTIAYNWKINKIIFPVYNAAYHTIKKGAIYFYSSEADTKAIMDNIERTSGYIANTQKHIAAVYPRFQFPAADLHYIISDGYFTSLAYYGFQNYFNVSQYIKNLNTILDVGGNGFYQHELNHYLFSGYTMSRFLNEGLATLFSGGQGRIESNPKAEWKKIQTRIKSDPAYKAVFDNADSLLNPSYSHEMYYSSAILLYEFYLLAGEKQFMEQLFEKCVPLTGKAVLDFIKNRLGVNQLSEFLETIDPGKWDLLRLKFAGF